MHNLDLSREHTNGSTFCTQEEGALDLRTFLLTLQEVTEGAGGRKGAIENLRIMNL
jgi:hypothetical protein